MIIFMAVKYGSDHTVAFISIRYIACMCNKDYYHMFMHTFSCNNQIVQALISVQALVFDLAQLICQKRFDCRNAILRSSTILLGTSYSQIVVAVLL